MSFIGAIGRAAFGAAKGFVTGGPGGALKGAVTSLRPRPAIAPRMLLPPGGKQGPNLPAGFPGAVPEPGFKGGLQRFLPGGQSGFTGAPPGFHVNKTYLRHLRAQALGRETQNPFNEQRAVNVIVRNRSMNPLNPRALRSALRRTRSAVSLMRRALAGSGYTISRRGLGGKGKKRR